MLLRTFNLYKGVFVLAAAFAARSSFADQGVVSVPGALTARSSSGVDSRYGLFDALDHRSSYGEGVFPEPFLVDDSDFEDNEVRLDWMRSRNAQQHSDFLRAEIEKGWGPVTFELEVPFERDMSAGSNREGFTNINFGARCPFFQYVSASKFVDTTFALGIEAGIPVHSSLSKNAELVPKIYNDLRLGQHFTLQSVVGWSRLLGPSPDGGIQALEYGFVFGWTIPHKELPLPGVLQLVPMAELRGAAERDQEGATRNSLNALAGFRINMKPAGDLQPRLGAGYIFPVDKGGRDQLHEGFYVSAVFEY